MERDPRDEMRGYDPDPRDFPDGDVSEYTSVEDLMVWKAFLAASKKEGKVIDPNSDAFQKHMYGSYRKYRRKENRNPAYKELGIAEPYALRSMTSIKKRFLDKVGPEVMHFSSLMQYDTSQAGDRSVAESYADSLAAYKERYGKNFGFNLSNTYYLENKDKVDHLIDVSLAPTVGTVAQERIDTKNAVDSANFFSPIQRAFGSTMEVVYEMVPLSNNKEDKGGEQNPYKSFCGIQKENNSLPPPTAINIRSSSSISQLKCTESLGYDFEMDGPSLEPSASQRYDLSNSTSYGADFPINSKDLHVAEYGGLLRGISMDDEQGVAFESSAVHDQSGGFGQSMLSRMRSLTSRQAPTRSKPIRIEC